MLCCDISRSHKAYYHEDIRKQHTDDEEKIIVEMDSEKQKINITPKLLSDLEVKNIFYKLN